MQDANKHLLSLHEVFVDKSNFQPAEEHVFEGYEKHHREFNKLVEELGIDDQLYDSNGRQMILADYLEYIFLGRGYYSLKKREDKESFVRLILHFVNLLMSYESMTVSENLRKAFLNKLKASIPRIAAEDKYDNLYTQTGTVGLKSGKSDAPKRINRYFDSLLPKTAGGLWHELLVFAFLLRNEVGYIVPLLLTQRFIGSAGHIVPPDFLIVTHSKNIYGIEVGAKKEIQSGKFSLQTNIPTATIDTENSRTSDRCPICNRWIMFCDYVLREYPKFDTAIEKTKIKCLEECDIYSPQEIAEGKCPCTKYSRDRAETKEYSHHDFANGYHYHYRCVLDRVCPEMKKKIIDAQDKTALITHYPDYSGIEELMK